METLRKMIGVSVSFPFSCSSWNVNGDARKSLPCLFGIPIVQANEIIKHAVDNQGHRAKLR